MRSQTGTRGTGRIPGTPPTPSSSAPVPRTTAGASGVWWSTEHSGGQTPWRRGSLSLSTVSLWPTTFKYHKIPLKQFTKFSPIFLLNPPPIKWNIQCIQVKRLLWLVYCLCYSIARFLSVCSFLWVSDKQLTAPSVIRAEIFHSIVRSEKSVLLNAPSGLATCSWLLLNWGTDSLLINCS